MSKPSTDHRLVVPCRPRLQLTYSVVFSGVWNPRLIRLFVARCFKSCVHPCTKFNLLALSFRFTACFASTFIAFCYSLFACFFLFLFIFIFVKARVGFLRAWRLPLSVQKFTTSRPALSPCPFVHTYIYGLIVLFYIYLYIVYIFSCFFAFLVLLVVCSMP